jgi:transcriptional regulator with PAS, ATPase and Fis domain
MPEEAREWSQPQGDYGGYPEDQDPEDQLLEDLEPEHMSMKEAGLELIEKALLKHGGNRKAAAAELGISERTLYRKIKNLNK